MKVITPSLFEEHQNLSKTVESSLSKQHEAFAIAHSRGLFPLFSELSLVSLISTRADLDITWQREDVFLAKAHARSTAPPPFCCLHHGFGSSDPIAFATRFLDILS